jgi:WD40 repeat protein
MANPYHVRLAISQYGERFRSELFTEDLGDTEGDLLPVEWEALKEWLPYLAQGAASLPPDSARALGKELFNHLLGTENREKWTEVLQQAELQKRPLRLLIDATTDAVRDLPYGLLCQPYDDYFLFRPSEKRSAIRFVRILRRCTPRLLNLPKPIRVLVVGAEPQGKDIPAFNCAARLGALARGLRGGDFEVSLCSPSGVHRLREAMAGPAEEWQEDQFKQFAKTTREGLHSALHGDDYDILHFIAHGLGGGLLLCDAAGGRAEVTAGELGEWCGASNLQMAFLQVCKGGRTDGRGGFGGLAQQLLNPKCGNLAAVVASAYPLDAERSTPAAISFYQHLAEGKNPDEALDRGLEEANWTWAFLELWVRPQALGGTGARGAFQYVSPYRGLAWFEERDADIFFGREAEVAELLQMLREKPVLAVAGDSGSGKSSLLQAGLAHEVREHGLGGRRGWQIVSVQPGQAPLQSLLNALRLTDVSPAASPGAKAPDKLEELRQKLREVLQKRISKQQPLLLLLDQFEQVFTLRPEEGERRVAAEVLAEVAGQAKEDFRLVLGMRCDYLGKAAGLPGLGQYIQTPWVLKPPGAEQVRAIVEGPAKKYGYTFQGPLPDGQPGHEQSLLDRILRDPLLMGSPEGRERELAQAEAPLPLLEFALERLWLKTVRRGSQEFRHEDFDQLGGLGGAVAQHADEVYQNLPLQPNLGLEPQALAEKIFTGVVSSSGTRRPRRRAELEEETGKAAEAKELIDHLVGERLLTVRSDPSNLSSSLVDLAHEVLISTWEQLKGWLDPSQVERQEVAEAAEKWAKQRGDESFLVHRGPRLVRAEELLGSTRFKLAEVERQYLNACVDLRVKEEREEEDRKLEKEEQRRRELEALRKLAAEQARLAEIERLRAAEQERHAAEQEGHANRFRRLTKVLAGVVVLAIAGGLFAWVEKRDAQSSQRTATVRELVSSSMLNLERNPELSLLLVMHAMQMTHARGGAALPEVEEQLHRAVLSSHVRLTLSGHNGDVNSVAWSPDGKRLATGSEDSTAKVWETGTGKELLSLSGHTDRISSVAWSPDGKRLATGSWDKTAKVWDVGTGKQLQVLSGNTDWVNSVAWSPDGKRLATGSEDGTAKVWDVDTGQELLALTGNGGFVLSVAWSLDGKRLAIGSSAYTAKVWDAATGKLLLSLTGHSGNVSSVAWSRDGKLLATGSFDDSAKVWDAATGKELLTLSGHGSALQEVAWSLDGTRLATASWDETAKVWNVDTGKQLLTLSGHSGQVLSVAWSPDGKWLATGSQDHTAKVWDVEGEKELLTLSGHGGTVSSVAWSPDGKRVATGSFDKTAKVWNVETGQELLTLSGHGGAVFSVAWSPDGERLATGSNDKTTKVWDAATGKELLRLTGHGSPVFSVAWSPDGKRLATENEWYAKVWDAATGNELLTLSGDSKHVNSVAWSPDGKRVATGNDNRTATVWDAATGKQLLSFSGRGGPVQGVAWSPDGEWLATGSFDHTAKVWDVATGKELRSLTGHDGPVNSVAWSPDGKRLATGSSDYTAKVWDARTGQELLSLSGHSGGVYSVAWSPDGKQLATSGEDGIVQVYAMDIDLLLALARQRVARNLTTDECKKYLHVDTCPPIP